MRGKIIAVFTVVVLVVGGLFYALTRATLGDLSTPQAAPRALAAAAAQLQVEGLVLERWLSGQAAAAAMRDPYNVGTPTARSEAATVLANRVQDAAGSAPELTNLKPGLVVLVDAKGVVLGRNGSALMRGDDLGAVYPHLKAALEKGATGSDVWVNRARNEQLLASYAPIRSAEGALLGGLVVGTSLNDERLSEASDRTSGRLLIAAVKSGDKLEVVAKSRDTPADVVAAIESPPGRDAALQALNGGQVVDVGGMPGEYKASSAALGGYGDGRRAVLISAARPQASGPMGQLLYVFLGVIALGLVLTFIGAHLLDAYISRPISEIEDGLLAIMNGKTDMRFELEHSELGGLVFRLNSLLNQLFGVQEDDTDAEGRPSHSPTATAYEEALAVDERMAEMSGGDAEEARALREEPDDAYYGRIFEEYIAAKTSLGDPVDHITKQDFIGKIMTSEREMAAKHGKPVRYRVLLREKQVVLLAVPLA